ncbi:MAG: transporter substrate-binding domain-containing protein [Caldilineaceae bacterium]|nr:transporter substrate-binding domain-containing protein [Caldilineaceae bacterium]
MPGRRTTPQRRRLSKLAAGGLALLLLPLALVCVHATAGAQVDNAPLRVVITAASPFVITENARTTGLSIEMWEEIAARMGVSFTYTIVDDVPTQLAQVENGAADVAVSALSITADRLDQVDFSVPYEEAGLQILVRAGGESFSTAWATFRTALSPAVLRIIAIFLGMIFLVANVTWFVDRKMNEDFPRPYWRGIWEAIWWSTVTVTTVGYGDKTPKSPAGRFVGILWMLLGLFLVANFTAGMTAALSVRALQSQISGLGDLDDMRVATVAGTSADTFMADNRLSPALRTPTIEEAFDALLANDVDAVLFDGPILLAFANTDGAGRVKVLAYRFDTEFYAFALPHDSPHRAGINQALLAMMEDGTYEQIRQRWLGPR